MNDFDLILRNGIVVQNDNLLEADVAVADGKIVAIEKNFSATAREEIDANGLHIFPGVIDSHVHFNEPGRADWEGIETGSRALAAGGGTLFFDMPLNAHPPTIDAQSFDEKLAIAKKIAHTDFAFWGGLVPENLDKLEELSERGVIGFKAFMSDSGIDDFSRVEDSTLREGMKRAAKLGKIVAVHAESEILTKQLAAERIAKNKISVRDYLDSRPIAAELDAIRRATEIAGETGCALHIVHVSCGAGIAVILEAQQRGVDVTCETCPHYLALSESDVEQLGAIAKCAPPLRATEEQNSLWEFLKMGAINTIGSDHSPSPPEMKRGENFFKIWGGISSVQHTLPILISKAHFEREIALPQIANLISFNVVKRFSLPETKGRIAVGCDADFSLVDIDNEFSVRTQDLLYRHKQTPYAGRKFRGKIFRTFLRGSTIFHNGKIRGGPCGRLVRGRAGEAHFDKAK